MPVRLLVYLMLSSHIRYTVNSRYCGHSREPDLVSALERLRNNGARERKETSLLFSTKTFLHHRTKPFLHAQNVQKEHRNLYLTTEKYST